MRPRAWGEPVRTSERDIFQDTALVCKGCHFVVIRYTRYGTALVGRAAHCVDIRVHSIEFLLFTVVIEGGQ